MNNLKYLIELALKEDIGTGDVTSRSIIPKNLMATAEIKAKSDLIVAGLEIANAVFKKVDSKIKFSPKVKDGDIAKKGTILAEVSGPARSLITAERTVLNFLQRLSGIATLTKIFVDKIGETNVKLLDTRKTAPGWRMLEKYAVKMGGGINHRIGLFDMYLIKNNHVDIAGSIENAIALAKKHNKNKKLIEVEVRNLHELSEALASKIDIVMLDNFPAENAKETVAMIRAKNKKVKIELSGNINEETIAEYGKTDADFISCGYITHSAKAADINMQITVIL